MAMQAGNSKIIINRELMFRISKIVLLSSQKNLKTYDIEDQTTSTLIACVGKLHGTTDRDLHQQLGVLARQHGVGTGDSATRLGHQWAV